nr:hypothetical protein BaRGS_014648 [Batillaria attramentaria]
MSAFVICLITLDRLLVLQFPLKRHLHLSARSGLVCCIVSWITCGTLAAVPLLPVTGWEFYSQTGICLPLPITRRQYPGQQYAFGIFIVLNFLLFLLIGAGQLLVYRAIQSSSMTSRTERRQQDMTIARRLFLVVFSDFCCWFPVGLLGMLAARGTPIPGEITVGAAIFVLPVNSALNPFLYTLKAMLDRRRKKQTEKLIKKVLARLYVDIFTWSEENVKELLRHCMG